MSATGVVIPSRPLVDQDGTVLGKDALLANLELHVCGPFNLARLAAAAFAENEPDVDGQRGVIVQTASISAFDGQVTMVPYAAAKGAIVSMTLPMARDLAPLGIRVCAIAPGAFATPRLSSPAVQQLLVQDVAFPKRVGHPEEYASLVEAIVRNPYLNGEVIRIDGRLVSARPAVRFLRRRTCPTRVLPPMIGRFAGREPTSRPAPGEKQQHLEAGDPAAVDEDRLAGDPVAGLRAEQQEGADQILGRARRLAGDGGGDGLAERRVFRQRDVGALVVDEAGRDGVDVDPAATELGGEVDRQAMEGELADAVDATGHERARRTAR